MDIHPGAANINFLSRGAAKGQTIIAGKTAKDKNQVIDGFVKARSSQPLKDKVARPATATARRLHSRGQKAQTLMRGALAKPADGFSSRLQNLRPGTNPQRELRARQAVRHSKVNRFGGLAAASKTEPAKEPLLQGEVVSRPAAKTRPADPAAIMPSMVTSASHHRLERMLDQALTQADAHKKALKYHAARHFWQKPGFFSRGRWIKLSVLIVIVLAASTAAAWQKIPQFSLKVASLRAHVDASIPTYKPTGYSESGPVKAADHAVTIQYASADDKSKVYTVNEQPSDQDSASLIADNTTPNQPVQTAQANGIPIVLVKNRAMCVSNGIKTTVVNQANLTPDELLNIAKGACS